MRKYPKKCKKCGEYMEPQFSEQSYGTRGMTNYLEHNPYQEPTGWICLDCVKKDEE